MGIINQYGQPHTWLTMILNNPETKNLFIYLCLSGLLILLEIIYGFTYHSLGLLCDSLYMIFHWNNLIISLIHIIFYRFKGTSLIPSTSSSSSSSTSIDHIFTYGYGRYEILAIFTNALCMIWICLFIFAESIHRLLEIDILTTSSPTMNNNNNASSSIPLSYIPGTLEFGILSLLLTISGIIILRPGQGIWQQLSKYNHGNTNIIPPTALLLSNGNLNTRILFSHIYADGVSSIALIIAAICMRYFGMTSADTFQAFFGACYILYIAIPLFTATGYILLQTTPLHLRGSLERCRRDILTTDGVIEILDERYWMQTPGYTVGSLIIRVREDANEHTILERCQRTFNKLITDLTIQVEKDPPLAWLTNNTSVPSSMSSSSAGTSNNNVIQIHTDH